MVIGHKSVEISTSKIRNVACPHCLSEVEMNYTVYSKYVHFYWIPFVPVEKIKIVECTSCKATFYLKKKSFPTSLKLFFLLEIIKGFINEH